MSTKVYVTDYEYATLEPEKRELNKIGAIMISKQCKTEEDVIRECEKAGLNRCHDRLHAKLWNLYLI